MTESQATVKTLDGMAGLTPVQTVEIEVEAPIRSIRFLGGRNELTVLIYTATGEPAKFQIPTNTTVKDAEVVNDPNDSGHVTVHVY